MFHNVIRYKVKGVSSIRDEVKGIRWYKVGSSGIRWDRLGLPSAYIKILYPYGSNKESKAVVAD